MLLPMLHCSSNAAGSPASCSEIYISTHMCVVQLRFEKQALWYTCVALSQVCRIVNHTPIFALGMLDPGADQTVAFTHNQTEAVTNVWYEQVRPC